MYKWLEWGFILAIAAFALFFNLNQHRGGHIRGVIWADAEGYYLHLPAVFLHGGEYKQMPVKNCCWILEDGKIDTRYTYGVAILETPFFLVSDLVANVRYQPDHPEEHHHEMFRNDGFSFVYAWGIAIAAWFYTVLGIWLLKEVLKRYFSLRVALFTVFLVLCGTNLLYYMAKESGMSHAYSFFLFSWILYMMPRFLKRADLLNSLAIAFATGLVVLIRPTNIIILLIFLGWEVYSLKDLKDRILHFLKPKYLVRFGLIAAVTALLFVPQMMYWKYMHGTWLAYSYKDEGFTNWNKPKLLHVWFSHQNGLFAYTQIAFFAVLGLFFSIREKRGSGILVLIMFLMASYLFASWWAWWFGGALGHRCFVEYYALLALPLGMLIEKAFRSKARVLPIAMVCAFLFFVYANIKMCYLYAPPWDGEVWTPSRYFNEYVMQVLKVWKPAP